MTRKTKPKEEQTTAQPISRKDFINAVIKKKQRNKF